MTHQEVVVLEQFNLHLNCGFLNLLIWLIDRLISPLIKSLTHVYGNAIIVDTLADPGGAPGAPPQHDPNLSFSHMFSLKSIRVGGWRPPNRSAHPQRKILDPLLILLCNCI